MNTSKEYLIKKEKIVRRLKEFKNLKKEEYLPELIFCILTPQSNAKKCWLAAKEIVKLKKMDNRVIADILKSKTRFHNNKSRYVLKAINEWNLIENIIFSEKPIKDIRNELAENVKGIGLKEASHFLRNIGKSNNQIAILDRHILKNLISLGIIEDDKIKGKKNYLEIESKFLKFSKEIKIPIDNLDLLFWSKENGEIFK